MRGALAGLAALILASCVATGGEAAPSPAATSPTTAPTSSVPASTRPTATTMVLATPAPTPAWARDVRANLECDGPPLTVGGNNVEIGEGRWGSAAEAVENFLRREATMFAWLPLRNYVERETAVGWALWVHEVEGRVKGAFIVASLTYEGWDMRGIAACDPAELAPGEPLALNLVIWTDGDRRVPTTELTERSDCHVGRILRVKNQLFARIDTDGVLLPREFQDTFAEDVPVPADADETPYRDRARSLWIAADGKSAFVGLAGSAERWPRVVGDEIQATDCN